MVKPTTIVVIVGFLTMIAMLGLLGLLAYRYVRPQVKNTPSEPTPQPVPQPVPQPMPQPVPQPVRDVNEVRWWEDESQLYA